MRQIEGGHDTGRDRQLLKDLAFIKRKLRYPISKRTLPAAFVFTGLIYLILRSLWSIIILQRAPLYVSLLIPGLTLLVVGSFVFGYIQTLRFRVIPTPFSESGNITLMHNFLRSQQLLIYELAEAPEVCQITSRVLGGGKEERREVMVFIADDNRILINSHFTGQKFTISSPSKNYKVMARQLTAWIQANYTNEISAMHRLN